MWLKMFDPIQTYEDPINYTPQNVIYWESTSNELRRSGKYGMAMLNKARKFLINGCIEQRSETEWRCKPIKDYNKTEYFIFSTEKDLACNCQGYKKKSKDYEEGKISEIPICSHTLAVKQFCFIEEKNGNL